MIKLLLGKVKDETGGFAIKEFVVLKPKMFSFFVDDSSEHKKSKGVNKNVVAKTTHREYKDVFLNKKFLRRSMKRIQKENHKIGTYEINNISVSCFDDKICILNSGYDGLALGC